MIVCVCVFVENIPFPSSGVSLPVISVIFPFIQAVKSLFLCHFSRFCPREMVSPSEGEKNNKNKGKRSIEVLTRNKRHRDDTHRAHPNTHKGWIINDKILVCSHLFGPILGTVALPSKIGPQSTPLSHLIVISMLRRDREERVRDRGMGTSCSEKGDLSLHTWTTRHKLIMLLLPRVHLLVWCQTPLLGARTIENVTS